MRRGGGQTLGLIRLNGEGINGIDWSLCSTLKENSRGALHVQSINMTEIVC